MIEIKSILGQTLLTVPVLDDAVSREELMVADYVQLSWRSAERTVLPVGSYILHEGEKYSLLEDYIPTSVDEVEYKYSPQFNSRIIRWQKTILPVYTYASDGVTVKTREFDWTFTGTPSNALYMVQQALKNELGEAWSVSIISDDLPETVSISSQSSSIWSFLSEMADLCGTEWWADKASRYIYFGKYVLGLAANLEVGRNVGVPTVTRNRTEYHTRFYAFGSTRNVTKAEGVVQGSIVNKRLTLDPVKYPNGYKDIKGHFESGRYVSDLFADEVMPTVLYFEDVYPSSDLVINGVRRRMRYRLDSDGNRIRIGGTDNAPEYEQYAIWYFKINGFSFKEELIIKGLELSVHFKSGQLRGREFALTYHPDEKKVADVADVDSEFSVLSGEYEIILDEQTEGFIIPSVDYLIPSNGDEVILFNIEMPSEYTSSAMQRLEAELDKEIAKRTQDNDSYEFLSNPVAFHEDRMDVRVGQPVSFKNGDSLLETRALMVEKHLDYAFDMKIRVGNEVIKGTRQQMSEEVREVGREVDMMREQSQTSAAIQRDHSRELMQSLGRYYAMKDTLDLLEDAIGGYTSGINPITVQTMAMLVGDESLQFRFTSSRSNLNAVACPLTYDPVGKRMDAVSRALIHMTLGIDEITARDTRVASDYRSWNMSSWHSAVLNDANKKYYVYAVVSRTGTSGSYALSETPIGMKSVSSYYYLLVGILNAEYAGTREFVTLYGFTEVLPSQITTDTIRSSNGKLIIDLLNAVIEAKDGATIKGCVTIQSGSSGLGNLSEWSSQSQRIDSAYNTAVSAGNSANSALSNANTANTNAQTALANANKAQTRADEAMSAATDADAKAEAAGNIAYKASQTLAEWTADGVISPLEKTGLQSELAFIYADLEDISKSYNTYILGFDQNILTGGKYELEDGQFYVHSDAMTNWQKYYSAYYSYQQDLQTKVDSEGTVAIGNLESLQTAFYTARTAMLESIALATKAEADYARKQAEKALADLEYFKSDYQYLKDMFGKPILGVDGVIMSRMMAVVNEINDIEAYLNGSDFANDSSHGKMLLAAGIPDKVTVNGTVTRDLLTRAKQALTKVFEDGYMESKNMHLLEGATIGSVVEVTSDGIQVKAKNGGQTSLTYSNGFTAKSGKNVGVIMGNQAGQAMQVFSESGVETGSSIFEPIGYYASMGDDESAYYCQRGMFSGLRPKCRSVSGTVYLSELDHTIFAATSSTTIKLPGAPYNGQEYVILAPNGGVQIDGNGKNMFLFHDGVTRTGFKCGDLATRTEVHLYWNKDDNKWWVTHMEN